MNIDKLLYTINDACYSLSMSRRTFEYMIHNGTVKIQRRGGRRLIPKSEVLRLAKLDDASPVCINQPRVQ